MAEGEEYDGATPRELVVEACRRDNVDLLIETLGTISKDKSTQEVADFMNNVKDSLGNHALHIAAQYGANEVLDELLNVEGLEVDPVNRLDGDTPLHVSIRYANEKALDLGQHMADLLCEAGADPRVRNKGGQKAVMMVSTAPDFEGLRDILRKAEYAYAEDLVRGPQKHGGMVNGDLDLDDGEGVGSASDSDG